MREIVLDTETTGLDVSQGHRIIEIGALEIINLVPSGKTLHLYINPERGIEPDAIKIHGITNEFVSDKPLFKSVAQEFLNFIKDDKLIIHNAPFDIGFLNFELNNAGFRSISNENVIDTLKIFHQTNHLYLNRSCGFKSNFLIKSNTEILKKSGWIREISIVQDSIYNEEKTNIFIHY